MESRDPYNTTMSLRNMETFEPPEPTLH